MSQRPVIALRPVSGKPSAEVLARLDKRWRVPYLLLAPHRLGFFLAMLVLVASGLWWELVQLDRFSAVLNLPYTVAPWLVHATVMVFGFIPLFFSGFLFTAGPKWLGVEPPAVRALLVALPLHAVGWLLWLAGAHLHPLLALAGLAAACGGLCWVSVLFWRLVLRSRAEDQLHARIIAGACAVGCISLLGVLGVLVAMALGQYAVARACVLTGLWGFVVVVYVVVAHRMIPFFTSSAMPMVALWRPFWVLWLMLAAAALEVLAVWLELYGPVGTPAASAWMLLRGTLELVIGMLLLWLASVWGLVQSLKNRLLAMLHIGFLWLGLAYLLGGAAQWLGWLQGAPVLGLGVLHALSMGCLASLMLAMVTRVSCGHSGRALVADPVTWCLFWLLQLATVLRIAAAVPGTPAGLLLAAALLWAAAMAVWGTRLAGWYGRLRSDGRPG